MSNPNPVYSNLTAQLQEVRTEIAIRERERKWIQNEIGKCTGRVHNTPQREQEIASTQRIYNELTKQYEDLKNKLSQAKLAESLENKQKGTQFAVVDPAGFPLKPSKPNRVKLILVGLLLSLGFGAATAFCAEFLNQTIWTQSELEKLLGLPVLVEIPEIVSDEDRRRRKKKKITQALAGILSTFLLIGAMYFSYSNPRLRAAADRSLDQLNEVLMNR